MGFRKDRRNRFKFIKLCIERILLTLPYLFGMVDMGLRLSPTFILNMDLDFYTRYLLDEFYFYYTNFQFLPHILFLGLYMGVIRGRLGRFSYFSEYHVMQYLVFFTGEQFIYDIYMRICFNYIDTYFAFTTGSAVLLAFYLLSLDCLMNIILGRFNNIPLITDAVLVHIGDHRNDKRRR